MDIFCSSARHGNRVWSLPLRRRPVKPQDGTERNPAQHVLFCDLPERDTRDAMRADKVVR